MVRKSTTSKTVAERKSPRSKAAASVASKKSTAITPRKVALAKTAQRLKSPKVLLPLAVAVGVGITAVRRYLNGPSVRAPLALPSMATDITPRFTEALQALAELGREWRAKLR